MTRPLTYLACPYSHPDPAVREQRFRTANRVAGILMRRGLKVFSPISHSHPIEMDTAAIEGFDFWVLGQDMAFLECSKELYVLAIDGWQESRGVKAEIARAREMEMPITYVNLNGDIYFNPDLHI